MVLTGSDADVEYGDRVSASLLSVSAPTMYEPLNVQARAAHRGGRTHAKLGAAERADPTSPLEEKG